MRSSATALRAQGQDVEHWLSLSRIVKLGIGTASAETIFLPNLIMSGHHLRSPLLLCICPLVCFPLHLAFLNGVSTVLTLAAMEEADEEGDDDDCAKH